MGLRRAFEGTPDNLWKWVLVSGTTITVVLLLVLGGWFWWSAYQSRGMVELERASGQARAAIRPQASAEARTEAIKALRAVIERYPRLTALPQAAHQLGNLHYQAKAFDEARKAYELCLARGPRGALGTLCRLGVGYAWEGGQGNPAKALAAYEGALQGLKPNDFLYDELSLGVARAYELLGQPAKARETYARLLKELPQGFRREEVSVRLASLEGLQSRP